MVGITAMLKNEWNANQILSRWYWTVDPNLTILFCVHNSINFDQLSNTTGWNVATNLTEPPCFTDGSRPSLLDLSPDLLWKWLQFGFITLSDLLPLMFQSSSWKIWHMAYLSIFFLFPRLTDATQHAMTCLSFPLIKIPLQFVFVLFFC